MASRSSAVIGAEAVVVARSRTVRWRHAADVLASWIVSAGGLATIASIVGIFVFICWEMAPLWRAPEATTLSTFSVAPTERLFSPATEEYRKLVDVVTEDGTVRFFSLEDGKVVRELGIPGIDGRKVKAVARAGRDHLLVATDDGRLIGLRLKFEVKRLEGQRQLRPQLNQIGQWTLSGTGGVPWLLAASIPGESGVTAVYAEAEEAPVLFAVTQTRGLFGAGEQREIRRSLPLVTGGTPTSLVVGGNGRRAYVATSNGFLHYWDLSDREQPRLVDSVTATAHLTIPVTQLAFLIGDHSLVVGDGEGRVSVWFPVRDNRRESGWRLQRVHDFEAHPTAVSAIAVSPRDRRFVTADGTGQVRLHHATTGRTLLPLPAGARVEALTFSPKANGGITLDAGGTVWNWELSNPHPEISLAALFGKIWYEGYEEPAYVWQSTGGTDEFEPKLSLVPLILGTMKGTVYALLFAVPIAVLAAIYTSQFAHPRLRRLVKPTVEIMAALPSVVLGFVAGLWLAPMIEGLMPGVLAMVIAVPAMMFGAGLAWGRLPARIRQHLPAGAEVIVLVPLVVAGAALCLWANDGIERLLFGGDFRSWLFHSAGLRFDQRNCVVVGFAMGFAVIPIIFTISEDALSNVPQGLISASLALGATRWQTAMRVVFPTASPGIFSATMIGFGRAVGETMIVLMATGNTPVLDWNIFTGMRTLSAAIAVEIPEAPYGSTLYRVLFLAALLLFVATFIVNTAAELVRTRLRRRYQQL